MIRGDLLGNNNRGVALILTIMIVSLIVTLSLEFNRTMRTHIASASNVGQGLKALYAAKSGISFGLALLEQDPKGVDSFYDDWADAEVLEKIGAGSKGLLGGGSFKLEIADASGKIPINQLAEKDTAWLKVFERFLERNDFGLDQEKVSTIVYSVANWVDKDDAGRSPFDESEDDYYMSLENPYHCKNGPIDAVEELRLVKGMGLNDLPEEVFSQIAIHISVFGDKKVNINTADPMILVALHGNMTQEMAQAIVDGRETLDEGQLGSSSWYHEVGVPKDIVISKEIIKTRSEHFRISSKGLFGDMTKKVVAEVRRNPDKDEMRILSWKLE